MGRCAGLHLREAFFRQLQPRYLLRVIPEDFSHRIYRFAKFLGLRANVRIPLGANGRCARIFMG